MDLNVLITIVAEFEGWVRRDVPKKLNRENRLHKKSSNLTQHTVQDKSCHEEKALSEFRAVGKVMARWGGI